MYSRSIYIFFLICPLSIILLRGLPHDFFLCCFSRPLQSLFYIFLFLFFLKITCPRCSSRQYYLIFIGGIYIFYKCFPVIPNYMMCFLTFFHPTSYQFMFNLCLFDYLCVDIQISLNASNLFEIIYVSLTILYLPVLAAAPDIKPLFSRISPVNLLILPKNPHQLGQILQNTPLFLP